MDDDVSHFVLWSFGAGVDGSKRPVPMPKVPKSKFRSKFRRYRPSFSNIFIKKKKEEEKEKKNGSSVAGTKTSAILFCFFTVFLVLLVCGRRWWTRRPVQRDGAARVQGALSGTRQVVPAGRPFGRGQGPVAAGPATPAPPPAPRPQSRRPPPPPPPRTGPSIETDNNRVLLGFSGFLGFFQFLWTSYGFYRVFISSHKFYRVLLGFSEFFRVFF